MRISAPWIDAADTRMVMRALRAEGHQTWFVGGCVRNTLLGAPVTDVDIATNARPETTMDLANAAGLRPVPTGLDHGTVTVVAGQSAFEVTTFRKDVETDGRHATVRFSDSIDDDAARRDFTMNALYASAEGDVADPVGSGLSDLRDRRVRFIGAASDRIREDYLRSLRFFRFQAWYGAPERGPDAEALSAISMNLAGLETLSKERVGGEMLKLLAAPDPAPATGTMAQTGVLARVLPGSDPRSLALLVHLEDEADVPPEAIRRLAVLGGADVPAALRLSKALARRLSELRAAAAGPAPASELGYRLGEEIGRDALLLRAALLEHPLPPNAEADLARGAGAVFPVRADDLLPAFQGAELGARLKELEARWIASGFALDKAALLS
ncbi:MAG: CCA tRNA nucleotidyltransferase [Pseudomonadota bacterium]